MAKKPTPSRDIDEDRRLGESFAAGYFGLTRRECSAWEWFVLKSSGDEVAARARWDACEMSAKLHARANERASER